jgi:hypothetical protein
VFNALLVLILDSRATDNQVVACARTGLSDGQSRMSQQSRAAARRFSLIDGGPFWALARRLHLVRPSGMLHGGRIALFAWLPLVLGEGVRVAAGLRPDPMLFDLSVHVRLLVALPTALFAERLVEPACALAIHGLYEGGFADAAALDRVVNLGERLRDSPWPEVALALLALFVSQLALWAGDGATGFFHGGAATGGWSVGRIWYLAVALPLWQFILFRWLWRWVIWSGMLAGVARLPLTMFATHPDRAAGLANLAQPVSGFGAFAFALGAMLASAWGTQILADRTTVRALLPSLLVFVIVMATVALAPLLLFCGHLFRARRRTLAE